MERRECRRFASEYIVEVVGLICSSGKTVGQVSRELGITSATRELDGGVVVTISAAKVTNNTGLVIVYQANLVVGVGTGSSR
jgi:hypothetical protein